MIQRSKASKEIELRTPSNPNDDQPSAPKTPKLAISPRVKNTMEPEEGVEACSKEQLSSSSHNTVETTVELTPPSHGSKIELDMLTSEEEVKDGNVCEENNAQVKEEKLENHIRDKNELEKETAQSKETDNP